MGALNLAASQTPDFLAEVVALLVGGSLIAYFGARLGVIPIVGFLLAGVAIGPNSLGLVSDPEVVESAAEIGVILLLFTIGLEFNLGRLAAMRMLVFVGGGLQVVLTTAIVTGIALLAGVEAGAAVFTGFLVALSSTAIVLALLAARGDVGEDHGRAAVGFLVFQDLAIIPMVLLVPLLGGEGGSGAEIAGALALAAGLVIAVLVIARRLMPPLLEIVARTCSTEVFLVTVVAICFGTAWVVSLAGVSVSLGAFLAGLIVAESRFSQHALGEILPLQIVFSGVFFASVGMLLDPAFVVENLPVLAGVIAVVLVVKVLATAVAARALGLAVPLAGGVALMLAQVGEFSFVLEQVGAAEGLTPFGDPDGRQFLIATTVLLMAATPSLMTAGRRLAAGEPRASSAVRPSGPGEAFRGYGTEPELDLSDHVILAGYGEGARALVPVLRERGVPYVITTLNPGGARQALDEGLPVLQGDHSKSHLLERAGIHSARLVVIADDDLETTYRVATVARGLNPEVGILAEADHASDASVLAEAGIDRIVTADRAADERLAGVLEERLDGGPGVDTAIPVALRPRGEACEHLAEGRSVVPRTSGCEACLRMGDTWVHLRVCLDCGHVGCCDSSPNRHASRHFRETAHPAMMSLQPGEGWGWCFVDRERVDGEPARELAGG